MALDTRIALAYQPVDWGNSLASGLKVANALRGDQLTPAERERLALAKAEFDFNRENALADNKRQDEYYNYLKNKGDSLSPWEQTQKDLIEGKALTSGQQTLIKLHQAGPTYGGGGIIDPDNPGGGAVPAPPAAPVPVAPDAPVSLAPGGPAPAQANVTRQSPAAAPPSVPANLAGKGAQWSPTRQQFRTPDGMIYNRQGIPVGG